MPYTWWRKPFVSIFLVRGEDLSYYKSKTRANLKKWIEAQGDSEWLVLFVPFGRAVSKVDSKISAEVYDEVRSDLPRKKEDRLMRLDLNDSGMSGTAWEELLRHISVSVYHAYESREKIYIDEIKKLEGASKVAGWNFCTFCVVHEGLAFVYEQMGLLKTAQETYEALQFRMETNPPDLAPGDCTAADAEHDLFNLTNKDYRRLIYESKITQTELRAYLFVRQAILGLAQGDVSGTAALVLDFQQKNRQIFLSKLAQPAPVVDAWSYMVLTTGAKHCMDTLNSYKRTPTTPMGRTSFQGVQQLLPPSPALRPVMYPSAAMRILVAPELNVGHLWRMAAYLVKRSRTHVLAGVQAVGPSELQSAAVSDTACAALQLDALSRSQACYEAGQHYRLAAYSRSLAGEAALRCEQFGGARAALGHVPHTYMRERWNDLSTRTSMMLAQAFVGCNEWAPLASLAMRMLGSDEPSITPAIRVQLQEMLTLAASSISEEMTVELAPAFEHSVTVDEGIATLHVYSRLSQPFHVQHIAAVLSRIEGRPGEHSSDDQSAEAFVDDVLIEPGQSSITLACHSVGDWLVTGVRIIAGVGLQMQNSIQDGAVLIVRERSDLKLDIPQPELLLCGAPQTLKIRIYAITDPINLSSLTFSSNTLLHVPDQDNVVVVHDGVTVKGKIVGEKLTLDNIRLQEATLEILVETPADGYLVHDLTVKTHYGAQGQVHESTVTTDLRFSRPFALSVSLAFAQQKQLVHVTLANTSPVHVNVESVVLQIGQDLAPTGASHFPLTLRPGEPASLVFTILPNTPMLSTSNSILLTYSPQPDHGKLQFRAPVELACNSGVMLTVKCETWATVGVPLPFGIVVEAPEGVDSVVVDISANVSRWLLHGASRVTLPVEDRKAQTSLLLLPLVAGLLPPPMVSVYGTGAESARISGPSHITVKPARQLTLPCKMELL